MSVASLITYGQWLLANPGAGAVANIAAPGCTANDGLTAQVEDLNAEGLRLVPAQVLISRVVPPATTWSTAAQVTLGATLSRPAEQAVDAAGGTSIAAPQLSAAPFTITLSLGADRRWRLCTVTPDPGYVAMADPSIPPSLF